MRILYNPQRSDQRINYRFGIDIITATIGEQSDTFDFSQMPDGEATEIVTHLPANPIISAKRVNGLLEVVLRNYIGADATEEERFPDWIEVE